MSRTSSEINRLTPDLASRAPDKRLAVPAAVIAIALIAVGFLSQTVIRHAIQIIPLIGVVILTLRGWYLTGPVNVGLMLFWLGIMSAIWLGGSLSQSLAVVL